MKIAEYFVTASVQIDKNSVKRLDQTLNSVEARLAKFSKNAAKPIKLKIENFDINEAKLRMALGNALDAASPKVAFEISKFVVNDRNMLAALLRAARRLPPTPPGPNPPHPPGGGPHPPYPPYPPYPPHPGPGSSAARYAGGGLITRGLSSFYGPALALGFGGYGLSQLNQKNQQVVSAQLMSQSVVQQAGGTAEQGQASFEWLRKQADRIGFNYLDAAPDYNKLLSGLTGAGMTVQQGQGVYKGFAELSRVNKLDRVTQNRLFRALSQVAGKDQLMSEELFIRFPA